MWPLQVPASFASTYFDRHCAVFADQSKLDEVNKIYLPQRLHQEDLGQDVTEKIHAYIRNQISGADPGKTLLISHIEKGPAMQMLIPFGLLNASGGDLDMTVECAEGQSELEEKIKGIVRPKAEVYYEDWSLVSGELSDVESDSQSESESEDDNEGKPPSNRLIEDRCWG